MNILELSEQEIGRRESLKELRNMGIDPYPAAEYPVNAWSNDIRDNFVTFQSLVKTKRATISMNRLLQRIAVVSLSQDV